MSPLRPGAYIALLCILTACRQGPPPAGGDDPADTVHAGEEPVSRVTLTEAAWRTAGIVVTLVGGSAAATDRQLIVPGHVEFDPRRVVVVSSRIAARVESLAVVEGDPVTEGQVVALLYSPAWIAAQADWRQALRRARVLAGTADQAGAEATADAARRRLVQFGASVATLRAIESADHELPTLNLEASMNGTIMDSRVLPGQAVEAGQEVYRLADLSVVDVVAAVPEAALPLVRIGQAARIELAAYPSARFTGRVERLRGELDPETRTVAAVIHAGNSDGRLRPGMFATVSLAVPTGAFAATTGGVPPLTIPARAVVTDGQQQYVFVEVGVRSYEQRLVELVSLDPPGSARAAAEVVGVRSGLVAGELVVVAGAFTLKSELAKARLGEHGH